MLGTALGHMYDPDRDVDGQIAARLSFWPELEVAEVQAAVKNQRVAYKGSDFVRRKVPDDLVDRRRWRPDDGAGADRSGSVPRDWRWRHRRGAPAGQVDAR